MTVNTVDPSVVAMIGVLLSALVFPFMLYNFKKNERLHEQTQTKVNDHAVTIGLHEYRLISLEEWRRLSTGQVMPITPPNVTVNN